MAERMRDGIIQRGKTWSYVVRERDPKTGKTKPRWVGGFATRKAAKSARDDARHAVNNGTYVAPQNLTVGEWLDRWITSHEIGLKPSTAKSYHDNIDRYLKPAIGSERVQSLSPSRLSIVFRRLHEAGGKDGGAISPRTVAFARAVLRRAMQDALLDRVIQVNPVIGTKVPKVLKPQHSTWTGAQVLTFIAHTAETRWASLWVLAAATGMRRGELMGLRWADIDLESGVVRVDRAVTQIRQTRTYGTPKNNERRQVRIDPHTVRSLKSWRSIQSRERLAWGETYQGAENLVFTWEDGSPVQPDYVSKAFVKAQQGAGLPRLVLHELRHTHVTLLLREGTPVHVVAERVGHKDSSVTLKMYAHAIPDDDDRAVEVFTRVVWGASNAAR